MHSGCHERAQDQVFGELLERYRRALVSVGLEQIGRLDAAEEIAQQAIATAWERRGQLRDPNAAGGWLLRIALNCCLQWHRREERWTSLEAAPEIDPTQPPLLEEVLRRETIREARRALEKVPFKNRIALLMSLSGHSYEEIAAFCDVPLSTVRGRIARARGQLRKDLTERLGQYLETERRHT